MSKLLFTAAASAVVLFAQPATAAVSITDGTVDFTNAQGNLTLNGSFGDIKTSTGTFTDVFLFDTTALFGAGLFEGTLVVKTENTVGTGRNATAAGDINLGPIFINGVAIARTSSPSNLNSETFTISGQLLNQGLNTITVGGNVISLVNGTAQYNGSVSLAAAAAVPEPTTWAMMLVGFGAVGYSMRRRKVGYGAMRRQAI
jgi:hypothetical protein